MDPMIACVLLALAATSLDNLGLGVQKAGSSWMEDRNPVRFAVWVAGILMCIAAPVTLGLSLTFGPASVVSALGAFGLVPLYLFAGLVLRENVTRYHYQALVFILLGVGWIGAFTTQAAPVAERLNPTGLAVAAGLAVLVPAVWSVVAVRVGSLQAGLALGCLSGALGGLNLLILKVGALLQSWWTTGGGWILVSILAFLALQVAYRHGAAVQIVPSNTATAVLVPVAAAPIAFGEPLTVPLLVGIAFILVGIRLIGRGEEVAAAVPAT